MDVSSWLRKQLEETSPDLLRAMVKDFAEALMSADADAVCGAGYGERTPARVNRRNGYRDRDWDTRVGSIELAVPKLREGSYFPDWLLQPRRRAEQAFASVIADASWPGVPPRRVEKLVHEPPHWHPARSATNESLETAPRFAEHVGFFENMN